MTTFADAAERLGESGFQLLARLVELHLNRKPGSRAEFVWITADSMASDFTVLQFGRDRIPHDPVDFRELRDLGLVRRGEGKNAFRLAADAIKLNRLLTEAAGPSAVEQVDTSVRTFLDDPARLARRHPAVARHLQEAFDLLWTDRFDDRTIINIGGELRSALAQMAADLVGYEGDSSPESTARALKPWLDEEGRLPPRTPELMFELLRWAAKATQRIHHLHDNRSKDVVDPDRPEVRRTAFAVAFVLAELDSLDSS